MCQHATFLFVDFDQFVSVFEEMNWKVVCAEVLYPVHYLRFIHFVCAINLNSLVTTPISFGLDNPYSGNIIPPDFDVGWNWLSHYFFVCVFAFVFNYHFAPLLLFVNMILACVLTYVNKQNGFTI
jgi:hypothetical protein